MKVEAEHTIRAWKRKFGADGAIYSPARSFDLHNLDIRRTSGLKYPVMLSTDQVKALTPDSAAFQAAQGLKAVHHWVRLSGNRTRLCGANAVAAPPNPIRSKWIYRTWSAPAPAQAANSPANTPWA